MGLRGRHFPRQFKSSNLPQATGQSLRPTCLHVGAASPGEEHIPPHQQTVGGVKVTRTPAAELNNSESGVGLVTKVLASCRAVDSRSAARDEMAYRSHLLYVTQYCYRAGGRAPGPDFGRILIEIISNSNLWPAFGRPEGRFWSKIFDFGARLAWGLHAWEDHPK